MRSKENSKSYERWKRYSAATTLREVIELFATSCIPSKRKDQISRAREDNVSDCLHGYIIFPEHEYHSYQHFFDAASVVALTCGTTCAAQRQEQDATSRSRAQDEQKPKDAVEHVSKKQRVADAEKLVTNYTLGVRLLELGASHG